MPHVRPSVHPDFLSSSLALMYFMRLSLVKAAHASVGGASCRKSGTMGRKKTGAALRSLLQFDPHTPKYVPFRYITLSCFGK